LFDEVVETDYGQFDLVWDEEAGFDGDYDRFFAGQENGLVGAADESGLYMNLARRSGGSSVRIIRHDAPPVLDLASWEDVVEVSTTVPDGSSPRWATWAGEDNGQLRNLTPGTYRVRVSARGRDAGRDGEFADQVVDFYLVEFWPAAAAPDTILQTQSQDASYWHQQAGHRR
jgi:hypothetical protein